ncbi:5845_t:CDS:2 [Paraglomus brasilianum]|uniref:5845_t:CDS:1 n=1 Tax=Paraglomus brasilianum TaxID=144538 RepID=A0A9N9AG87_9GLOM|nr:5845_t:CDS:2 [Paraglomus brasilianum]
MARPRKTVLLFVSWIVVMTVMVPLLLSTTAEAFDVRLLFTRGELNPPKSCKALTKRHNHPGGSGSGSGGSGSGSGGSGSGSGGSGSGGGGSGSGGGGSGSGGGGSGSGGGGSGSGGGGSGGGGGGATGGGGGGGGGGATGGGGGGATGGGGGGATGGGGGGATGGGGGGATGGGGGGATGGGGGGATGGGGGGGGGGSTSTTTTVTTSQGNTVTTIISGTTTSIIINSDVVDNTIVASFSASSYSKVDDCLYATAALVDCSVAFKLKPVPRSGGHSYEEYSSLTDSIVIDLSRIAYVSVDTATSIAVVGGGIRLGTLYLILEKLGFTIPGPFVPTIGISGLISSGGYGLGTRKYGITADLIIGAVIVDVHGNALSVSATENADIFWAIRGGGGGTYGIITQLKIQLQATWADSTVFSYDYDFTSAATVIKTYSEWSATAAGEITSFLGFAGGILQFRGHYIGTVKAATPILGGSGLVTIPNKNPILKACPSLLSRSFFLGDLTCKNNGLLNVGTDPFAPIVGAVAGATVTAGVLPNIAPAPQTPRENAKAKSIFFNAPFTVEQSTSITTLLQSAPAGAKVEFFGLGGILATQVTNLTAYFHRKWTLHVVVTVILNGDATADAQAITWINRWDTEIRIFATTYSYNGYVDADLKNATTSYYGDNEARLKIIKGQVDPTDIFGDSQSIFPQIVTDGAGPCNGTTPPGPPSTASLPNILSSWSALALTLITLVFPIIL